ADPCSGGVADPADHGRRGGIVPAAGKKERKKKKNESQRKSAQVNISALLCFFEYKRRKSGEKIYDLHKWGEGCGERSDFDIKWESEKLDPHLVNGGSA
ncbi:MAG: hypothetical protein CW335_08205, partial [Clostridiales bacterium]|nr:hypothetical protein [Clostridiales bacterium]